MICIRSALVTTTKEVATTRNDIGRTQQAKDGRLNQRPAVLVTQRTLPGDDTYQPPHAGDESVVELQHHEH
jgi:hypothetical protein